MLTIEKQALILASASPRRQELLREAGIPFQTYPAHIPEQRHARAKQLLRTRKDSPVKKRSLLPCHFAGRFILGADTIVVVDEDVLEKPLDHRDAARMLRLLSGRGHNVITGVSLVTPTGSIDTRTCTTQVFFRKLMEQEIQAYVASNEPMDKAGAYAIQGGAAHFADRMEGEYSNVVGLPLSAGSRDVASQ